MSDRFNGLDTIETFSTSAALLNVSFYLASLHVFIQAYSICFPLDFICYLLCVIYYLLFSSYHSSLTIRRKLTVNSL